jgi:hypothetical protein
VSSDVVRGDLLYNWLWGGLVMCYIGEQRVLSVCVILGVVWGEN